jgi:threonine dehydratase
VVDLSENEVAILPVRQMVGGTTASLPNEKIFRFEFPERPGALLDFLNLMGNGFNITMFHYRNHGAAYGRVLAGIEIPADAMSQFKKDLQQMGYRFWEETDNTAYKMFLTDLSSD